jgi:hypothetical protein
MTGKILVDDLKPSWLIFRRIGLPRDADRQAGVDLVGALIVAVLAARSCC